MQRKYGMFDDLDPIVHILMPAYNAKDYIMTAIHSVLNQTYKNFKLIIYNDGSTDDTLDIIHDYLTQNSLFPDKIHIFGAKENKGVACARQALIQRSKELNVKAYILFLDADDRYTDEYFILHVIRKMQRTQADICLFNFSIKFEEDNQKSNAAGLIKEKNKCYDILQSIDSSEEHMISPLDSPNLMEFTSLGWTKCIAPTVRIPHPVNCPFEDFVYMAMLLHVNKITALPAKNEPIEYLRRSTSICGKRTAKNFSHDIPEQLLKFFSTVLDNCIGEPNQLKKLLMAQDFVLRKITQYSETLTDLINENKSTDINQNTLTIYQAKVKEITQDMANIIKPLIENADHENEYVMRNSI